MTITILRAVELLCNGPPQNPKIVMAVDDMLVVVQRWYS